MFWDIVSALLPIGAGCGGIILSVHSFRKRPAAGAAPKAATQRAVEVLYLLGGSLLSCAILGFGVVMLRHPMDSQGFMSIPKQGPGSEPILMPVVVACLVSGFLLLFAAAMTAELTKGSGRGERGP